MIPRPLFSFRYKLLSICSAVLALSGGLGLHAAEAPSAGAKIEQISPEAIALDGKLDESLYRSGEWNSGFTIVRSSDKAVNQTAFRLFTDGQKLYFTARMHKNGGHFRPGGSERDSVPLHSGDHINLFFRATNDPTEYLQFLITPSGKIADVRLTQSGVTKDYSWNTDVIAVSETDPKAGEWTVEMAVPLAALNIDPAAENWHVNVGRLTVRQPEKDGGPREFNSWIPSPTEIENAGSLAPISLPTLDRSVFGWRVHYSPLRVILKEEEGEGEGKGRSYLATTAVLSNQTGSERTVSLHTRLEGIQGAHSHQSVTLAAGETREVATLTPLGKQRSGEGLFRLSIMQGDGKSGGNQLCALSTEQISFSYTPAVLKLTAPGYRATIFASQNLKTLRAELVRWDTYATIANIEATLLAADGTRYPAIVAPDAPEGATAEKWQISLDGIDRLADGTYQLEVRFTSGQTGQTGTSGDSSRRPVQTLTRELRKVPAKSGEIWIDEKGVVYRDGKPFPAYGFHYGRRDPAAEMQALLPGMFYNTYLPVWVRPPYDAAAKKSIENLAKHQILSVVNVMPALKGGLKKNATDSLTPEEHQAFRELALAMRDTPNIIGYYLADEPEYRDQSPRRLRQIYEVIRDNDPYHPVILTNNTDEAVRNYQNCSDIHNPDPYPLFLKGGGPARHFTRIATHVGNVQIGEESYRALWITPQGFDLLPFRPGESGHRGPTAVEMRAQQTIALIHRAVGITWYTEETAWEEPGVTSSIPYLSQEYAWLFPHITAARPQILETPRTATAALSVTPGDAGNAIVMVVNLERADTEVTLRDARLKAVEQWHQIGEKGETLPGGKESLTLKLAPHESVILVSAALPLSEKLGSWKSVLEEEKRLDQLIDRSPQNIALAANGSFARPIKAKGWNSFLAINGVKEKRSAAFFLPHFKKGEGLEITFPEERLPRRLVLTGSNILTGSVQVQAEEKGARWVEVARINHAAPLEAQTLQLEGGKARRLRIVAETVAPLPVNALRIVQAEVYEE